MAGYKIDTTLLYAMVVLQCTNGYCGKLITMQFIIQAVFKPLNKKYRHSLNVIIKGI